MRLSSFRYLTRQGLSSMVNANRMMTLASMLVLLASLVLTGAAYLFSTNVDNLVEYLGEQNETVVYLHRSLDEDELQEVDEEIRSIDGIAEVTYVSKEEVLETYKGYMEEYAVLFDDFEEDNPFRANYRVTVESLEDLASITDLLEEIDGVESVSAPTELGDVFLRLQGIVNICGIVIVLALALVSIVSIANTIRLTVYARRREIGIMKLVGATNGFIRLPFFVEGLAVGLIAAVFATIVVLGGYAVVLHYVAAQSEFWGALLLPVSAIWKKLALSFVGFALVLGGVGTTMSIRRYLEV